MNKLLYQAVPNGYPAAFVYAEHQTAAIYIEHRQHQHFSSVDCINAAPNLFEGCPAGAAFFMPLRAPARLFEMCCTYAGSALSLRFGKLSTGGRVVLTFRIVYSFAARSAEKLYTKD